MKALSLILLLSTPVFANDFEDFQKHCEHLERPTIEPCKFGFIPYINCIKIWDKSKDIDVVLDPKFKEPKGTYKWLTICQLPGDQNLNYIPKLSPNIR